MAVELRRLQNQALVKKLPAIGHLVQKDREGHCVCSYQAFQLAGVWPETRVETAIVSAICGTPTGPRSIGSGTALRPFRLRSASSWRLRSARSDFSLCATNTISF